jgi:hypothetical protein
MHNRHRMKNRSPTTHEHTSRNEQTERYCGRHNSSARTIKRKSAWQRKVTKPAAGIHKERRSELPAKRAWLWAGTCAFERRPGEPALIETEAFSRIPLEIEENRSPGGTNSGQQEIRAGSECKQHTGREIRDSNRTENESLAGGHLGHESTKKERREK